MNNNPKIITFYLPQFHSVPENDEWWGSGYTEWTAVKSAEVLFEGHKQPVVPLNQNYYDILDEQTMLWQLQLMRKYGVFGQCFYHYYFKDGKKILEKPAEKLLGAKDIDMPFCLCWANETWARTWSKVQDKNDWGSRFETKQDKAIDDGVLIEQDYGEEELWKAHFYYLLQFFRDKRYIRHENRPIFLIYKPERIACLYRMRKVWDKIALQEGIERVYIIGANTDIKIPGIDRTLLLGPKAYLQYLQVNSAENRNTGMITYDYGDFCQASLAHCRLSGEKSYYSVVSGYDDTPRRGLNGYCLTDTSAELFEQCLMELLQRSKRQGLDYIFINAWNEWGEGMHLEPDEENGYQYLEAVKRCTEKINTVVFECGKIEEVFISKEIIYLKKQLYKQNCCRYILNKWDENNKSEKKISIFFENNRYKDVAVYGYGEVGRYLVSELKNNGINVKYIVEEEAKDADIISLNDFLNIDPLKIDVIVITPILDFEIIADLLYEKLDTPIYSIKEIVDMMPYLE